MPDNYRPSWAVGHPVPRAKFIHCRRDPHDIAVSCWITHFRHIRWANDRIISPRDFAVPTPHGALAAGLARARAGRWTTRRRWPTGGDSPTARGLVRPGLGAGLPGVPRGQAAGETDRHRPGAPAGLRHVGGKMDALRTGPCSALRPAGRGALALLDEAPLLLLDRHHPNIAEADRVAVVLEMAVGPWAIRRSWDCGFATCRGS